MQDYPPFMQGYASRMQGYNDMEMEEQYENQLAMEEQQPLIAKEELFSWNKPAATGLAYVRWGRTTCPTGAELVYAGRAGGSHFNHRGGGSNYQCVTLTPENFDFGPGTVQASFMYGSEYEMWGNVPQSSLPLHDQDVPCAVCYVAARTAKIVIPGTYNCPAKWTREYYGYLMAEKYTHHRSTFECVDKDAEPAKGGHADHNGALFYHIEPRCGSLPCPPYDQQKEVTCAVCTR